jgi:glycogen operon protein
MLVADAWLGAPSALVVLNGGAKEVEVVLPAQPGTIGYRLLWDSAWETPRDPGDDLASGAVTVPATSLRVYTAC